MCAPGSPKGPYRGAPHEGTAVSGWRHAVWPCLFAAALAHAAWDTDRMTRAAQLAGPRAVAAVRALQALHGELRPADDITRLRAVNDFYNQRIEFKDDLEVWSMTDHWATPLEMFDKGAGDCEDYAIAKYLSLLALGLPNAKLRLVYVRATLPGTGAVQAHMVLAYHESPMAEPLILDNLIHDVRAASRRPDLAPVFSFNSVGLWQGVGSQSAGDPVARLSRWRELLAKAAAEGFF